jgi:integrase/recombinase XerD
MVFVLRSFVRGPLEPYVVGFAEELARLGYTRCSAEQHVCFIAHLDRWLTAQRLGAGDLNAAVVDRYLAERRAAGYVNYRSGKAMRPLLSYLDQLGVLPREAVELDPVSGLLERYRSYLLSERGLTSGTARCYLDAIRPFVTTRLRGEELDLAGVTAADVTGFVVAACPGRPQGTAKLIVTTLRSLLTWLHIEGVIAERVGWCGASGGRLAADWAAPRARARPVAPAAGQLRPAPHPRSP